MSLMIYRNSFLINWEIMTFFSGLLGVSCLGWEVKIDMSGQSNDCLRICNVKMKKNHTQAERGTFQRIYKLWLVASSNVNYIFNKEAIWLHAELFSVITMTDLHDKICTTCRLFLPIQPEVQIFHLNTTKFIPYVVKIEIYTTCGKTDLCDIYTTCGKNSDLHDIFTMW